MIIISRIFVTIFEGTFIIIKFRNIETSFIEFRVILLLGVLWWQFYMDSDDLNQGCSGLEWESVF